MNLPFFIARRYFLSKKKKSFINVISVISMVVVAIGTACLIIALSFFNGLEGLLINMYGNFDPDLVIQSKNGKSFIEKEPLLESIRNIEGVQGISEVIEDNVLLRYKESQRVVRMKGVGRAFDTFSGINQSLVSGDFSLVRDSIGYALIGRGVQYDMSISLRDDFYTLQLYYPRDIGPGVINPDRMYRVLSLLPGGVFAIEKYYDENYVFVPVEFARQLLNYEGKLTAYELYLDENLEASVIRDQIQSLMGGDYSVKLGEELHSDLFKVLKIEKLFVFLILTSIIAIASINIYFSLTMLVIEKKKDISVLISQGAPEKMIRNIFLLEGVIVAFTGAAIGLILGITISWIQQEFGIITMGMQSAVTNSYPVKIETNDVVLTIIAIIGITLTASIQPALKAGKGFSLKTLQ